MGDDNQNSIVRPFKKRPIPRSNSNAGETGAGAGTPRSRSPSSRLSLNQSTSMTTTPTTTTDETGTEGPTLSRSKFPKVSEASVQCDDPWAENEVTEPEDLFDDNTENIDVATEAMCQAVYVRQQCQTLNLPDGEAEITAVMQILRRYITKTIMKTRRVPFQAVDSKQEREEEPLREDQVDDE